MTIHLDHAATSWPKPPSVARAMTRALELAGNPSRGSSSVARGAHAALEAARAAVASFLGCGDATRLAFTLNATDALNTALRSLAVPGSRVVVTSLEHAAVMRPLRRLARERDVVLTVVDPRADGRVDPRDVAAAAAGAAAVVVTAASNVTGAAQDVEETAALVPSGTALVVDAAQAAGSLPLRADAFGARAVTCFSGHKALLGPMGCGGLVVGSALELAPARLGGTGDGADEHPESMPARLEAGTVPLPAILGLHAGVHWWQEQGPERVRARERELVATLLDALRACGARIPALRDGVRAPDAPLVGFTLDGYAPEELAQLLDARGITVRAGLHCSPDAHRRLGTWPDGLVRASVGPTSEPSDVAALAEALRDLA